jgi:hypothetical protein
VVPHHKTLNLQTISTIIKRDRVSLPNHLFYVLLVEVFLIFESFSCIVQIVGSFFSLFVW